ncbi:sugar phosphate isomerase/epimerase [Mucilaginibacter sabulilitoris]|uniref:Sugar phosphate isomerase/epimerase n=1 Tax=Mucilaginibacter sabulilitoris TaxID=1173583 RepID=A0ABZ0TJ76_9SPHI|nr:sugar phosphate isomerase/epimerase [Mucilaginibacter sabulilitoris]WPU92228.1 sugar phosphate isomerase/epimerase [Mucilaginibacter sabulilitoris]
MQNRRQFIITGLTGSLALAMTGFRLPGGTANTLPAPGVQLFTFFNVIDNNVAGTMHKVAETGVKNIESAFSKKGDYYGMPAKEFTGLLKSLRMSWRSHHVFGAPFKMPAGAKDADGKPMTIPPMKNLKDNLNEILEDASAGGLQYLVAAHLPIGTKDEIKFSLDILNQSAPACKKAGIQLVYHNEPADFKIVDGQIPYEVFLTQTDPDALKFELDIAWAIKAGQDPLQLFSRYPGRFPLWHIKDLSKDYTTVLPVGDGVLDNRKYFESAQKAGLQYYFIEHEAAAEPFPSIGKSIRTINSYKS